MVDIIARALALQKNSGQSGGVSEEWVENRIKELTIINSPISKISESSNIISGEWSLTENADVSNSDVATYVTIISLPSGYTGIPVTIIKDERGFLNNVATRIEGSFLYVYSNLLSSSDQIIIKL
jgi:hypothetical protein